MSIVVTFVNYLNNTLALEFLENVRYDVMLVIYKIRLTSKFTAFPTLIFLLQGGREVSDFISFIEKKATNKPVVVTGKKGKKKAEL